jgi:hypothetical protein
MLSMALYLQKARLRQQNQDIKLKVVLLAGCLKDIRSSFHQEWKST